MDSIMNASQEVEDLYKTTKQAQVQGASFFTQASALTMKYGSFYKRSWPILVVQFFITFIFLIVMFAMGRPAINNFSNNLHPPMLPPPAPIASEMEPIHLSIPFGPVIAGLGSCCTVNSSGLLSNVDFSILNSSQPNYFSLGNIPTSNYSFVPFNTMNDMFSMLYDTSRTGWLAAYTFPSFDLSSNTFHIGLVKNISEYGARGAIGGVAIIDNALLKTTTSPNNSLVVKIKDFPSWEHELTLPGFNVESTWLLLACSFFMVTILSLIVREKSDRLRYLMVVAGMKMRVYWTVTFLVTLLIYFALMVFFLVLGIICKVPLFTLVAAAPLLALFWVFAFNQIGFAFLMSTFFNNAASASLAGYVWILFFVILTQSIVPTIVDLGTDSVFFGIAILPHFGLSAVANTMKNYYYPTGESMSTSEFSESRMRFIYVILFAVGLVLFVIHQYIEQIYPAEFGIPKHPLFFLKYFRMKSSKVKPLMNTEEPEDVKNERNIAIEEFGNSAWTKPLVIPGISKIFKSNEGTKSAIENMALTINMNECFGLLGPNGGGKTTLVNILSGLYPVTKGDAKIQGKSVVTQLHEAQRHTGVCPQDSVFWPEMSAREHLLLFGRLRNLRGAELDAAIELALKQTLLTDAADRPAGGYSGGMKRRLSLAIAFIGFPEIVLLDEPTTGVDPFSRRVVWEAIRAYKKHVTTALVTHNMEEADLLCDRVAVVNNGGKVMCVGHPTELKTRYEVGYTLSILFHGLNSSDITQFIENAVPQAVLVNLLPGSCIYAVPKKHIRLSTLFMLFKQHSPKLGIVDWAILPAKKNANKITDLEEVLLKSTGNHDEPC